MSAGSKHTQEDRVNGLSPAKVPKLDEESDLPSREERVSRVRDFFNKSAGGRPVPPVRPKPAKKAPVKAPPPKRERSLSPQSGSDSTDGFEDPGPVILELDSLKQFHQVADFDLNAVVRNQMLDNTPQKERAALSHSKGLQNRRLPANMQTKVPDDYQQRRRAQTYSASACPPLRAAQRSFEETDIGSIREEEEETEEERRKKIMMKAGIGQSNPLAALGSILRKGSGRKSKSPAKASPHESPSPARKISAETSKSPPKSPKGFRFGIRRSSSRTKKSNLLEPGASMDDDARSETSSVCSLNIHPMLREGGESMETEPSQQAVSPLERSASARVATSEAKMIFSSSEASSPTPAPMPAVSVVRTRKDRDSGVFKEAAYEPLFSDDSALFGTTELDAILGTKLEKTPERTLDRTMEEAEEEEKAEEEERKRKEKEAQEKIEREKEKAKEMSRQISIEDFTRERAKKDAEQREKKRSDIRSRMQLYETYSKSHEDVSTDLPVATSSPKHAPVPSQKSREDISTDALVATSSPKQAPVPSPKRGPVPAAKPRRRTPGLFDSESDRDNDPLLPEKTVKGGAEPGRKASVDKMKAKIFEDELFQEDIRPAKPARSHALSPKRAPVVLTKEEMPQRATAPEPKVVLTPPPPISPGVSSPVKMDFGPSVSLVGEQASEKKAAAVDPLGAMEVEVSVAEKEDKKLGVGKFSAVADILEYDDSPLNARKVEETKAREEDSTTVHDLFGASRAKSPPRSEEEEVKPKVNLFGEEIKEPQAGRRAVRLSSEPADETTTSEVTSDPLGAIKKTEIERESEEREQKKAAAKAEEKKLDVLFDEDMVDISEIPCEGSTPADADKEAAEEEKKKETKKEERVKKEARDASPRTRRSRDRPETKAPTTKESKVSSARSRFDPAAGGSSPRTKFRSTDSTDRKPPARVIPSGKDSESGKPSWMVEMQKRKDERKKSQSGATKDDKPASSPSKTAAASTKASSGEDLAEWQKKIRDRRKHRDVLRKETGSSVVAAKSSKPSSQSDEPPRVTSEASKTAERKTDEASDDVASKEPKELETAKSEKLDKPVSRAEKSPRAGRKSPAGAGRKSPAGAGRKSPAGAKDDKVTSRDRRSPQQGRKTPDEAATSSPRVGKRSPRLTDATSSSTPRSKSPRMNSSAMKKSEEEFDASMEAIRARRRQRMADREQAKKREEEEADQALEAVRAKRRARLAEREKAKQDTEEVRIPAEEKPKAEEKPMAEEKPEAETEEERTPKKEEEEEECTPKEKERTPVEAEKPSPARKPEISSAVRARLRSSSSDRSSVTTKIEITSHRSKSPDDELPASPRSVKSPELNDREEDKSSEDAKPTATEREEKRATDGEDDVFVSPTHSAPLSPSPAAGEKEDVPPSEDTAADKTSDESKLSSASPEPKSSLSASLKSTDSTDTDQSPAKRSSAASGRVSTKTSGASSDSSLPAWKKRLLEKKERGEAAVSPSRKSAASKDDESAVPAWKKELLAKRKGSVEIKSTKSTTSSSRSKKNDPPPAFMTEFQKRKEKRT